MFEETKENQTTEQEEAIRLLNGLEKGEEPEEGQKIFLP